MERAEKSHHLTIFSLHSPSTFFWPPKGNTGYGEESSAALAPSTALTRSYKHPRPDRDHHSPASRVGERHQHRLAEGDRVSTRPQEGRT